MKRSTLSCETIAYGAKPFLLVASHTGSSTVLSWLPATSLKLVSIT
ncbi:MAG: hypothetical protein HGA22_02710 [Clostridiales bacterium]|nr:hypothetical protein [Clostridiales bacterium]